MKSIKTRLSITLIALTGAILLMSNILIFFSIRNILLEQVAQYQRVVASSNQKGMEFFFAIHRAILAYLNQ